MIQVARYDKSQETEWNSFVGCSKNGTFLFNRGFMDYHADRFTDASLVFRDAKGDVCGLLPANYDQGSQTVVSHGGLTYGGLIISGKVTQTSANAMLALAAAFYSKEYMARSLIYKPVPYIYHTMPAQEDLYALHCMGATLKWRAVSSTLVPACHLPFRKGRKACITKARRLGLEVERAFDGNSLQCFHELLSESLGRRHNVSPVHSFSEMNLLMKRFPNNIQLYVAKKNEKLYSGAWVFITDNVVHTQYLVNTDEGRGMGAEDILLDYLINHEFVEKQYFDFGISTEKNGTYLNENLISMKEGFGARSVCYDTYELSLAEMARNGWNPSEIHNSNK